MSDKPLRLMRARRSWRRYDEEAEDPLAGVANLFDVSLAFIVALLISVFMLFSAVEFLDPQSTVTIVKERADGSIEIVEKKGEKVEIKRSTDKSLSGEGELLGTAYRLANGEIVYVPQEEDGP
jgi:hypothetical protein